MEVVSKLVVKTARLVLWDINIHAEATFSEAAQDFMVSMTTIGLSHAITNPTCCASNTFDLVFCFGHEKDYLKAGRGR